MATVSSYFNLEEINYLKALFTFISVYALYYFYKVVHRPQLIAKDGKLRDILNSEVSILKEHFWPTFWACGSHLQTIGRVIFKSKPTLPYRREVIETADKGHIALDWIDNDENNVTHPLDSFRPTIIILPGVTGCRNSSYIRHIALESMNLGYRAVVFNNRGLGEIQLKTPKLFAASDSDDLVEVINHVIKLYPCTPIMLFGVSFGGMVTSNYLIDKSYVHPNIIGAMVVSMPWNCETSSVSMETPFNRLIYNRHLANNMVGLVRKNWSVFEENLKHLPLTLEDVSKKSTMREFDDYVTAKMFGFPSADEYFNNASICMKPLENIKIPVLYLNARDDPFAPIGSIPLEEIEKHSNLAIVLTDCGGHIGFTEGVFVRDRSFVERLFAQFTTSILKHYA